MIIPGGPEIKEQLIQSIFQDFAQINSYLLRLVGKSIYFPVTPRSLNLVENFLFYETFLMDCHCRDLPDFQSFEAR